MGIIVVSAVVFERADGCVLTVRKRGTTMFMLPGGKPEADESAAECAAREVHEELGLVVDPSLLEPLGTWDAPAANESGFTVRATVFAWRHPVEPAAQAEIEDARWIDPAAGIHVATEAPLNREAVFPLLLAQRAARPARAGSASSDSGDR